jgi:hypothetical protein
MRECPLILFRREKFCSQLASEAGIEMTEMILSTRLSHARSGVFLARKVNKSIYGVSHVKRSTGESHD